MVRRLETPQQPVPDERGGQARPCGRAQGIRDLEGDDSISTNQAATIGSCEATREGTYRRVTKEGQSVRRTPPNTRLKLAARVDCEMDLSSVRRSLGTSRWASILGGNERERGG